MKSITVVVPTYNSMKYLKQCIDSVLSQDYENMKIWACDNESTDGTYKYLKSLNDKRLSVFNLPNRFPNGYREAIEYVFQFAKTDFITFISSDDIVNKSYISKCMKVLYNNPKIECLQSPMICINDKNETTGILRHHYKDLDEFKKQFLIRCPVNNPSVVYHRSLWPLIRDGREAHRENNLEDIGAGDYDLWGSLALHNVFIHPSENNLGYFYRWHPGQMTNVVKNQAVNFDKYIQNYYRKKWGI